MEPFVVMTNKNLEPISAMLDSELTNSELDQAFDDIHQDQDSKERFGRYALIGDVLRQEQELIADDSFAMGIQAAIENIELPESGNVSSIASHPKWHQRVVQKLSKIGNHQSVKGGAQFAIAASVALVAVFGVSNMKHDQTKITSPVLSPVPLVQGLSPVSADGLKQKPTANQVTQSRINALMADHNQQLRATEDDDKSIKDEEKKID